MAFKIKNFYQQTSPLSMHKGVKHKSIGSLKDLSIPTNTSYIDKVKAEEARKLNEFSAQYTPPVLGPEAPPPLTEAQDKYNFDKNNMQDDDLYVGDTESTFNDSVDSLLYPNNFEAANRIGNDGSKKKFDIERFNKHNIIEANREANELDTSNMPQYLVDVMNQTKKVNDTTGNQSTFNTDVTDQEASTDFSNMNNRNGQNETNKLPSNGSGVKWSEAPAIGTDERRDWYIKNNLKLDHTTPEQVKEPVVDKIVNEEETEVVAEERRPLNRRQRRTRDMVARNDARRVKRGLKLAEKVGKGVKDGDFDIPKEDFQDPNIA